MKWIIWTSCAVLAILWTGTLGLVAFIIDWTASSLGQVESSGTPMISLSPEVPVWLSQWIDPKTWTAFAQAISQSVHALEATLPVLGALTGWLEPLVWVLWGFGVLALLSVALGLHWLVRPSPIALKLNA